MELPLSEPAAGLVHGVAGVAAGWLVLGTALHLANQLARGRGWWAILRAATSADPRLRRRDAIGAWIAGAGAGGLVTARLGDALRVALVTRRVPEAGGARVAGTLVAEAAGELAGGLLLVPLAVAAGIGVPLPPLAWAAPAALAVAAATVLWRRRAARPGRLTRVLAGLRDGCAALASPRRYARGVAPWQLAGRALQLLSLACFLAAFHLPATPAAVLVVVFAQGSGRLIPFSPAAAGAGAAVLAATFGHVTGTAVPAARLAAFLIGMTTVLTAIGVVLAALITLRTASWRVVVAAPAPAPAPAPSGGG